MWGRAWPVRHAADLLSYWDFNNYTASASSLGIGSFNTTAGSTAYLQEVYNPANFTLSPATSGVFATSSSVNMSMILMGSNGNPTSQANQWGAYAGDTGNGLSGVPAGGALAVTGNGNNGSYVTFALPTLGYNNVVLTYDTRSTLTGYSSQDWQYYSVSSGSWIDVTTISEPRDSAFHIETVNLPAAVNNLSNVNCRVLLTGASSTSGNNRFDNVQFNAAAYLLATSAHPGVAAIGMAPRRAGQQPRDRRAT